MKIAIATDDKINICPHFGRTKGFSIFEIENGKVINQEYRINTFTGHARGLEGNHSPEKHRIILEALKDCEVVIANGMGHGIRNVLQNADIQVYITNETLVNEAVEKYLNKNLNDNPEKECSP